MSRYRCKESFWRDQSLKIYHFLCILYPSVVYLRFYTNDKNVGDRSAPRLPRGFHLGEISCTITCHSFGRHLYGHLIHTFSNSMMGASLYGYTCIIHNRYISQFLILLRFLISFNCIYGWKFFPKTIFLSADIL